MKTAKATLPAELDPNPLPGLRGLQVCQLVAESSTASLPLAGRKFRVLTSVGRGVWGQSKENASTTLSDFHSLDGAGISSDCPQGALEDLGEPPTLQTVSL